MPAATHAAFSPVRNALTSNPFYLLSACCMLGGCLALTNSLSWTSIPISRLLILIATLNLYEAALIGLGMYLIIKRGAARDAIMLLILEAFFLSDITFLNAEIATARLGMGLAIGGFLLAAAAIKLSLIFRTLGLRHSMAHFAFIMLQLAAVVVIPLILPHIHSGTVTPIWFYGGWWLVALLLASYELLPRFLSAQMIRDAHWPAATMFYLSIPWLSLAAHLGILHYVYQTDYFAADAAPLLLALTLVLTRLAPVRLMSRADILTLRLILPVAAVAISVSSPAQLNFALQHGQYMLTTLRIAFIAAYLTYTYCLLRRYWIPMLAGGATALAAFLFGPSPAQVATSAQDGWDWLSQATWKFVPKTLAAWGAVAIAASFAFLGLGAVVSLKRKEDPMFTSDNLESNGDVP
jgi:hypothetical protein